MSTHDTNNTRGDSASLSGGESGSDGTRSDPGANSPSQPKAPFPHGMFQIPVGMHNYLSRSDNSNAIFESDGSAKGHLSIGQHNNSFASTQIQPQEQGQNNFPHNPNDQDRQRVDIQTDLTNISKSFPNAANAKLASQLEHMCRRRDADCVPGVGNNGQIQTPPQPRPHMLPHSQHRLPSPQLKMPPPHPSHMPPTFQQLQHLAQQQFMVQQNQPLQARQSQPGLGKNASHVISGHRGPMSQDGVLTGQPSKIRSPVGGQSSLGRGPQGYTTSALPGPAQMGMIGQAGLVPPQVRPPNAQMPLAYTPRDVMPGYGGQKLHSREHLARPRNEPSMDTQNTCYPQPPFSLNLPSSCPNTESFGRALLSQTNLPEVEAALRLTPGAGPSNVLNSPFFPRQTEEAPPAPIRKKQVI